MAVFVPGVVFDSSVISGSFVWSVRFRFVLAPLALDQSIFVSLAVSHHFDMFL